MEITDRDLVARARRGDDQAFVDLMGRHADDLYGLAMSLVGNTADAQDLLQETFKGAWVGLAGFREQASVRTWLTRILVRQIAGFRRSMRLRRTRSIDQAATDDAADKAMLSASNTSAIDARLDLAELLDRLTDEHRQVLVLRELQGMSYNEMAELLHLPRGTIESRLFRARAALRELAGPALGLEPVPQTRSAQGESHHA